MGNRDKESLIVATTMGGGIKIGTTKSVVLREIGVSARKLWLAENRGAPVVVRGEGGEMWLIREVSLLRVKRG